jgi:hypothetical protein
MYLRFATCFAFLFSLCSSACTSPNGVEPSAITLATSQSAVAPVGQTWRMLVESLASHPEVLNKEWAATRRILPLGCFRKNGSRDLSCPPVDGVVRISVDPGPGGIIDVVLKSPADCLQIYTLMSRHLGEGVLENSDKCTAEWSLKRWVKKGSANLSKGVKDPSQLYLQFAVEQGP